MASPRGRQILPGTDRPYLPLCTPLSAAIGILLILAASIAGSPGLAADPTPAALGNRTHSAGDQAGDGRREPAAAVPDAATLERRGAVIGAIDIHVGDIFDPSQPGEDRWLYRTANRLHIKTRESVIRRQLLLDPGDPFSQQKLEESERLLRANRYLYDAEIHPVRYESNRVDLEVVTRDVWTLSVGGSFNRSGGENETRVELQDSNFLGTGKDLKLQWRSTVDRETSLVRYRDPNLLGSRARLEVWFANNSDGDLRRLDAEYPFYSLESRRGAGLETLVDDRIDKLYSRGEIRDQFRHEETFAEIWGGISRGLVNGRTRRWIAGFTFEEDRFAAVPEHDPSTPLPADRTLSYPWIGFESVEDDFVEVTDLDKIHRTEDLHLGWKYSARLGWSSPLLGGDADRFILRGSVASGFDLKPGLLVLVSAHGSTRLRAGDTENLLSGAEARVYWRNFGRHLLFGSLSLDIARDLDRENQLLLGGDSGLRGYPLRFQEGDRRFLLTLEERFYTGWHPLRLAYVGAAIFLDVGRAWFAHDGDDQGVLHDVGVGLRLASSRSGRGSMLHVDLALPLDRDPSIDSVQWLITTKETF